MSAERNFTDQDYELLSAYLDGALAEAERTALETRLQTDDKLRQELAALQQTVNLVRGLPPLKAPRNFTLTPSMVRLRPARWLIFPTSTAFSAISAAAATVLILLGAGMLLLQSTSVNSPNSVAQPVAMQRESTAQIASLPTQTPLTSEKTAERDQRSADETAAAIDDLSPTSPPSAVANGAALPDPNAASNLQQPQVTNEEQPAPVTTDGLGYTTESTQGGETGQAAQPAAPPDSTLLFAATMASPSELPVAPGAADSAAQTGGSIQQEAPQASAAAEILSDQIAMTQTGAQFGADNQDAFGSLTATMPIVEQFAAAPSASATPNPTLTPSITATTSPTAAPTPTPMPTQTPRAPPAQSAPSDVLTWSVLIIGVLLLVIAIVTTIVRRRG
jgi:hypothetical protein